MKIENIIFNNHGYVKCRGSFYTVLDLLGEEEHEEHVFSRGINWLQGEIDSGIWAKSYFLSMFPYRKKDFVIFDEPMVMINNQPMSMKEFSKYSCYMDELYPLFSSRKSVRQLVEKGIRKHGLNCTSEAIRNLFEMDLRRFDIPLKQVGNARFRCMASIAYSNNKEVYCFPWLSKMRFDYYHGNLSWLINKLKELDKVVIVPLGKE